MILISFGTRPEWIKIKPILDGMLKEGLKEKIKIFFTGQHGTMGKIFKKDSIWKDKVVVANYQALTQSGFAGNRLDEILENIIKSSRFGIFNDVDYLLVQGDTASSVGMALCAFHRKIPVIHLEAGLRSNDNHSPYPEEVYRRNISAIADIHLCPTNHDANFLRKENINGDIHIVGNTALDNLTGLDTSYNKTILITLHRRENQNRMKEWFLELEKLAKQFPEYKFTFPMHPSKDIQKYRFILSTVDVVEPLGHDRFLDILANCSAVISDSGGVSEEASFLGKCFFNCRLELESERHSPNMTFVQPENLVEKFKEKQPYFEIYNKMECPFGDGKSVSKIMKVIKNLC